MDISTARAIVAQNPLAIAATTVRQNACNRAIELIKTLITMRQNIADLRSQAQEVRTRGMDILATSKELSADHIEDQIPELDTVAKAAEQFAQYAAQIETEIHQALLNVLIR